jgi:hypothetical protein
MTSATVHNFPARTRAYVRILKREIAGVRSLIAEHGRADGLITAMWRSKLRELRKALKAVEAIAGP